MKVLLLGGAGFIGCSIAKYLVGSERDYKVTIADNFFRGGGKPDEDILSLQRDHGVTVISGDFTHADAFDQLDDSYDQVYMLASIVGVDYVNSMPHEIIRINTMLIMNTLEWLKKVGCGCALFTSTSETYAGAIEAFGYDIPTPETVPLTVQDIRHPRFTYAVTKMLGESGFFNYARKFDFDSMVIRYHNVYGPRMGFKHVIPHLAQRFTANEDPFKIQGHDQTRAFNYIDDAVQGTVLVMEKGVCNEIYHIGDTDEITIEQLVRYVGELFDYQGTYEPAPTYAGSVGRRCPDISKAKRDLGYSPSVSWRDGVRDTIQWYRDYLADHPDIIESFYDRKD